MAVVIALKGWVSGMTKEQIFHATERINQVYPHIDYIAWDGDLLVTTGTPADTERGTDQSFTACLPLLKEKHPETCFVAFKKQKQTHKLEDGYNETTKHGSVETGYDRDRFGELYVLTDLISKAKTDCLNVFQAPNDIGWKDLGIINVKYWHSLGFKVHYITIGGGEIVGEELAQLDKKIHVLWRLEMTRVKGDTIESVEERYEVF